MFVSNVAILRWAGQENVPTVVHGEALLKLFKKKAQKIQREEKKLKIQFPLPQLLQKKSKEYQLRSLN